MDATPDHAYRERCSFQHDLDQAFPNGAVCAILPVGKGSTLSAGRVEAAGRVFCSAARPSQRQDEWDHEVLIDIRTRDGQPVEELRLWVGDLRAHPTLRHLWEAPIRTGDGEQVLRLNAGAPPGAMPTPAMRTAVTTAHEHELFPAGLLA
ncbi:MAG: hypothetical protein MUP76_09680 [Acidimicrobiia bacterium]|nr:hypothetical protein [Acidimicrobiia bacterium]